MSVSLLSQIDFTRLTPEAQAELDARIKHAVQQASLKTVSELQKQIQIQEELIKKLQSETGFLKREIRIKKGKEKSKVDGEIEDLRNQLVSLQKERTSLIASHAEKIRELDTRAKEIEARANHFESEYQRVKDDWRKGELMIRAKAHEIEECRKEVSKLEVQNKKIKLHRKKLKEDLHQAVVQQRTLQNLVDIFSGKIEEKIASLRLLKEENEKLQGHLDLRGKENQEIQEKIEAEKAKSQERITKLEGELQFAREQLMKKEAEVQHLSSDIRGFMSEIHGLKEELQAKEGHAEILNKRIQKAIHYQSKLETSCLRLGLIKNYHPSPITATSWLTPEHPSTRSRSSGSYYALFGARSTGNGWDGWQEKQRQGL